MNAGVFRLSTFIGGFGFMFCLETLFPSRWWDVPRKVRFLFHAGLQRDGIPRSADRQGGLPVNRPNP